MQIYVDADACPVKAEVYRVAARFQLPVVLVANSWMRIPRDPMISLEVVADGLDAADDWIADRVQTNDVVITADIPLASRCVKAGAKVLGTTGKPFTEENIGVAVATRDLLTSLRDAGEHTGGPPPIRKEDRSRFLQKLDEVIRRVQRSVRREG